MHTVKIYSIDGKTRLTLDGVALEQNCIDFCLTQSGGERPVLRLSVICDETEVLAEGAEIKTAAPAATGAAEESEIRG